MSIKKIDYIKLEDVFVAYRKAKVDLFYEHLDVTAVKFAEYEEQLEENIKVLHKKLSSPCPDWHEDLSFLGNYSYALKGFVTTEQKPSSDPAFLSTDPDSMCDITPETSKLDLRLILDGTINFHIVSSLWIMKVGHKYDDLLAKSVYGTRLRRKYDKAKKKWIYSESTIGSFKHYANDYKTWREKGLSAIGQTLDGGKSVAAMTMDIKSFYHNVNPSYLLDPRMLETAGLTSDDIDFTDRLIRAMNTWKASTPDHSARPEIGLPVGLSCSKIIANVALLDFDLMIREKIKPIYYGRYVDDIFLVIKEKGFICSYDIWRYLINLSDGKLCFDNNNEIQLQLPLANKSKLLFTKEKQKFFILKGQGGKDLLKGIRTQINDLSSEWKLLSDLPDEGKLYPSIMVAQDVGTNLADSLRQADNISIRKMHFAIALRNLETIQKDLPPNEWKSQRKDFFDIVISYIISPKNVGNFILYYSRMIGLAIAAGDFDVAEKIIIRFKEICEILKKFSFDEEYKLNRYIQYTFKCFIEGCLKSFQHNDNDIPLLRNILNKINITSNQILFNDIHKAHKVAKMLTIRDLGSISFKDQMISKSKVLFEQVSLSMPQVPKSVSASLKITKVNQIAEKLCAAGYKAFEMPLIFPTRPLTVPEISMIMPDVVKDLTTFSEVLDALRGISIYTYHHPHLSEAEIVSIPTGVTWAPNIALGCFHTSSEEWVASVDNTPSLTLQRYLRINRLINDVLRTSKNVKYLVFPELSIPRKWADSIAKKLTASGISFITGVEYEHFANGTVSNQAILYLTTNIFKNRSYFTCVEEKQRPALDEGKYLNRKGKMFHVKEKIGFKKIYHHGSIFFSVLICSELTNIKYRSAMQGKVDVLFVLEWNRDITSFNSLVEATALDVHGFVVQVNNRQYGDSRIRGPYRKEFLRDIVRIKGGVADYFVVGTVNIEALREFQCKTKKRNLHFKPVPDGFEVAEYRKIKAAVDAEDFPF